MESAEFEIFLATAPGLEAALRAEVAEKGFAHARAVPGGVTIMGRWPDVWRANLDVRGATRVLARIGAFRAMHLAQLDKRARKIEWGDVLRADVPFRVEATCRQSRIYHSGAAAQRIVRAICDVLGARHAEDADICIRVRIEDDLCTLAVDTSGELLHRRGFKEAVSKAPMRETMAALMLRLAGYRGTEPVVDPMCGSGTFVIEAAEIAAGLAPGRSRVFAFEQLATFQPAAWADMRAASARAGPNGATPTDFLADPPFRMHGSDRDAGAIASAMANAERAGVSGITEFRQHGVSEVAPPAGPAGLVIVNPPYGTRVGDKNSLAPLYRALGQTLRSRFSGWRVGLVTTEAPLAAATGLPFAPPGPPIAHGGLRVKLFLAPPLP